MSISFSTITQKARAQPLAATTSAMKAAIGRLPTTTVSAIGNGVRVAAEENSLSQFATVGIWLEVGTKHDTRETSGLAKVLQHAGFQGTTNLDRGQLAKALDEIGGNLMVDTGREHSYVAVKCAKENVPKAVGILADVVRNARLSDADVAASAQQQNLIRHQSEELITDLVMDNLHVCAYDASNNGGLGLPLQGTEAALGSLTADALKEFRAAHYTGPRTLLVGAGAVSHAELEKLAQNYLGDMSADDNKPALETRYVGGDHRLWNLRMSTAHIAWGVETAGAVSADTVPLQLVTHIHGGWDRSQAELGQAAIHRVLKTFSSLDHGTPTNTPFPEQAPETMASFFNQYEDTGLIGMAISGRPYVNGPDLATTMWDFLHISMMDWARLGQKVVHQQELDQAKVNMKAQLLFNMDGATNSAKDIAKQVFHYGRRVPLDEMHARIDDVTAANIQEVLQHYYFARKPVVAMTGYLGYMPHYDGIVHWTYKYWY
jgi:predicted Zn-dependent peptidase